MPEARSIMTPTQSTPTPYWNFVPGWFTNGRCRTSLACPEKSSSPTGRAQSRNLKSSNAYPNPASRLYQLSLLCVNAYGWDYSQVWFRSIRSVMLLSLGTSRNSPSDVRSRTWTSRSSGVNDSSCLLSSRRSVPHSTSCRQAMAVMSLVHEAIQKTVSSVIGDVPPRAVVPEAWLKMVSPLLSTAQYTMPGIWGEGPLVRRSIAARAAVVAVFDSLPIVKL